MQIWFSEEWRKPTMVIGKAVLPYATTTLAKALAERILMQKSGKDLAPIDERVALNNCKCIYQLRSALISAKQIWPDEVPTD